MKKTIALFLALVMMLSLVACGGSSAPAATEAPKADAPAAEAPKATEAPKADPMKIDIASLYTDGTVCDDACIKLAELPEGLTVTYEAEENDILTVFFYSDIFSV